ncbi:MAG: GGDEF domain-containing protein [Neptuniibacter sp.]
MIETAPGSPKKPLILTGITASLCLLLFFHIQSTSENALTRYLPWLAATAEIKLETTMAHLWFEEHLSGDPQVDIHKVIKHFDAAEQSAIAILDGAKTDNSTYLPLTDPELRQQTNQLLYQLASFKKDTTLRLESTELNSAGTHIDQLYDIKFWDLINKIDQLASALQQHIHQEKQTHDSSMLLLLFAIMLMTGVSIFSISHFTLTRTNYLRQLSHANKRISEQNAQLLKSSQTDQLTGLPNRQMLVTLVKQILARVQRQQTCMSLTFIDLDFFKPINDQFGHSVGDKVLVSLTKTIKTHLRDGDILARLAGDEFILILQEKSIEELETSLEQILDRICTCLIQPITCHPKEIHIRFSAGTAIAPSHSLDFDELLHFADLAMYQSKQQGRGLHYFYSPEDIHTYPGQSSSQPTASEAATE